MKIILLAAGVGKRMGSVTELVPKPLLPINGIPIIDCNLFSISKLGFKKVTIVVNHLSELIINYCGNGKKYNLIIDYVFQEKTNGTGSAVKIALHDANKEDVMIVGGDTLFTLEHYKGLINFYNDSKMDGLLLLKKLPINMLARASLVSIKQDNLITKFIEKPKLSEIDGNISSALLHIYNYSFHKYLNELSISERGEYELTEATKNMIKDQKIIKGILMPKPLDLTDVKDLLINNFSYISNLLKDKG